MQTIEQAALHVWNLTGGKPRPEVTAETYRQNADGMRRIAARAAGGKARGIRLASTRCLLAQAVSAIAA